MKDHFQFALIGGGLTATSMLCQLVDKAQKRAAQGKFNPRLIHISILEKTEDFGPGFPHNRRYLMPFHITNMCASDMGVYADRRDDFQVWAGRNLGKLKTIFPGFPPESFEPVSGSGPCLHYPRAFMGEYLRARFGQAIDQARKLGMGVDLYPQHEVTGLKKLGNAVQLTVKNSASGEHRELTADAALLATGHWFPENKQENYLDSPWPAEKLLASIPPGASVAVIGTSLSAIETVLTLTSEGSFAGELGGDLKYTPSPRPRKITLYSRRGLLPKVRGLSGAYVNKFLTSAAFQKKSGRLKLETTFDLLNSELENAYGRAMDWGEVMAPSLEPANLLLRCLREAREGDGPGGELLWQTVLYQTFPFIRDWYIGLSAEDRKHFDREYTSAFFTHAAPQPFINASKLAALLRAGLVRIVRLGMHYDFARDAKKDCFRFDYTDINGHSHSDTYQYVVNAQGQNKSLETDPSDLARNLISAGLVQAGPSQTGIYPQGSLKIDPRTHRVAASALEPSQAGAIYAVGAMTRSHIIDASMAYGIALSTAAIAENLLDGLVRSRLRL